MDEKVTRELRKLSQIRAVIGQFLKGDYGDDEVIATREVLGDVIAIIKEGE